MRRLLVCSLLLVSCGSQTVTALGLYDPRLPPDSRSWVADADDQIVVARAWAEEAEERMREIERWREEEVSQVAWPDSGQASAAEDAREEMADLRVELARLEYDRAKAQLGLAYAKWRQVHAETAMRHDIAVYDLKPILDASRAARGKVEELVEEIDTRRLELTKATTLWWNAYQAFVKSGGRGELLWVQQ